MVSLKDFIRRAKNLARNTWFPIVLVVFISSIAFLPLMGRLGFYHDDWFTTASRVSGVSLFQMHSVDRPHMGNAYEKVADILGESPFVWQLFSWGLRTCISLLVILLVLLAFPNRKRLAVFSGILFLIYPGFLQQSSANNYSNHWIAMLLGVLTLCLSARAARTTSWIESIIEAFLVARLTLVYPRIYETFIGFEALNILIVVYILWHHPGNKWLRLLRGALVIIPPLVAGMYVLYWRFFLFNSTRVSTDETSLIEYLRTDPFQIIAQVFRGIVDGLWKSIVSAWVTPLQLMWKRVDKVFHVVALTTGLVGGVATYLGVSKIKDSDYSGNKAQPIIAGLIGVLITLIPVYIIGRSVEFKSYNDRYTLQSMVPLAIVIAGLLDILWRKVGEIAGAILASLGIVTLTVYSSYYAINWHIQQSFWWQMAWRAPQLADGTNLIVYLPPGYRYPEEFEVWAPANRIYAPQTTSLPITAALLGEDALEEVIKGGRVGRDFRTIKYVKDYDHVLLITQPTRKSCIHAVDGSSPILSGSEPEIIHMVANISRLDQIETFAKPVTPPGLIFGREPKHGWCYYYQKTDLAVQQADYRTAVQLADEAIRLDLSPADLVEWMPFYRAYAYAGRTADAIALAEKIQMDSAFTADYCARFDLPTLALQSNMEAFITINLCMPELSK